MGAGGDDDANTGGEVLIAGGDCARTGQPATAVHQQTAMRLISLDRVGVIPAAGNLITDLRGQQTPIWHDLGIPGHAVRAARLLQQIGGAVHALGGQAGPIGAADQRSLDADDFEAGLEEV